MVARNVPRSADNGRDGCPEKMSDEARTSAADGNADELAAAGGDPPTTIAGGEAAGTVAMGVDSWEECGGGGGSSSCCGGEEPGSCG